MEDNNPLEQFNTLKEQLNKELNDLEAHISLIEREYELLEGYKNRRDDLREALFGETIEINMEETPESMTAADRVLKMLEENPGASKQDLRGLLPDLTNEAITAALSSSSKKGLIGNRGSKQQPSWYLT